MSTEPRPFVIYSTQRSGSTMLIHLLDEHSELCCAGEVFKLQDSSNILHPELSFQYDKEIKTPFFSLIRNRKLKKHLKKVSSYSNLVVGFKVMISQIDAIPNLPKLLSKAGYRSIVLIRKNIVKQCLSVELARAEKSWINVDSNDSGQVSLDIGLLSKSLKYYERSQLELQKISENPDSLTIYYEDVDSNVSKEVKAICDYIGVANTFTSVPKVKKSSTRTYEERISNYREVKDVFAKLGYNTVPI